MIPEEVKQYIGKADSPTVREVERGAIRRYADAVGNQNPLYYDEEYAHESIFGGIITPPGFFGWPTKTSPSAVGLPHVIVDLQATLANNGFSRMLDGGISYDFFLSVYAGDILICWPKISNITEKEGKSGAMMVCYFEITYLNQNGDMVARSKQTLIAR
jgi:hypothetical protein